LDVLIFGGGAAGLWLLDELVSRGYSVVLLERDALGAGQTVASQGIIHGGIKYTLSGALTGSARAIREMPERWRECMAGRGLPRLGNTRVLSECCYLWRTESLKSKMGMVGARVGLRSGVTHVEREQRPAPLRDVVGPIFRVEEQVIDVMSFLADLSAPHRTRLLRIGDGVEVDFTLSRPGRVSQVALRHHDTNVEVAHSPVRKQPRPTGKSVPQGLDQAPPQPCSHQVPGSRSKVEGGRCPRSPAPLAFSPRHVVFAAGAGNHELRQRVQFATDAMQRRPLHMILARGDLPRLYGHCVDGARTRVTVTTAVDAKDRSVWHIGGKIAEDGVDMSAAELIARAKGELRAVLPGVNLDGIEWATYRIDRAEGRTAAGSRPEGPTVLYEDNVITAWPTKLALVPDLARRIAGRLAPPSFGDGPALHEQALAGWARPEIANPPWEAVDQWRE